MHLFIPVVGTQLRLRKDTRVSLKNAAQNGRFVKAVCGSATPLRGKGICVTLPKGLVLTVDRVYIRQGQGDDYNSLTFKIDDADAGLPKGRFFLPVDVVNTLDVDVVSAAPEPVRINNIRTQLAQHAGKHSINERIDGVHIDRLMDDVASLPAVSEGVVLVNLRKEYQRFDASLQSKLAAMELDSVSALYRRLRDVVEGDEREGLESYISDIAMQNQAIEALLKSSDEEELYNFRVLQAGDEPALHLTPLTQAGVNAMSSLSKAYKTLSAVYNREYHPEKSRWRAATIDPDGLYDHMRGHMEEKDTFGFHYYRHNHNPKQPILNKQNTQGVIPMDAFPDNLFTRTRNVGHGYVFTYLTDQDQRLSVSDLRKMMKELVTTSSQ